MSPSPTPPPLAMSEADTFVTDSRELRPHAQGKVRTRTLPSSQFAPKPRFIFSSSQAHHQEGSARPGSQPGSQYPRKASRDIKTVRNVGINDDIDDVTTASDTKYASSLRHSTQPTTGRTGMIEDIEEGESDADLPEVDDDDDDEPGDGSPLHSIEDEYTPNIKHEVENNHKRRHPSSSPPRGPRSRTKLTPGGGAREKVSPVEPLRISVSPSPEAMSEDGFDTDDNMDLMPAPRRPTRRFAETPSPTRAAMPASQQKQIPARSSSDLAANHVPSLPAPPTTGAAAQAPISAPPRTPVRHQPPSSSRSAARFRFTTPLRTPLSLNQVIESSQNAKHGKSDSQAAPGDTTTATVALSTPNPQHPQFVFSPAGSTPGSRQTHQPDIPLPEIFSPRRRQFVPGGVAEKIRDMVLEAGGSMHTTATRRVYVTAVARVGKNGALAIEGVDVNLDGRGVAAATGDVSSLPSLLASESVDLSSTGRRTETAEAASRQTGQHQPQRDHQRQQRKANGNSHSGPTGLERGLATDRQLPVQRQQRQRQQQQSLPSEASAEPVFPVSNDDAAVGNGQSNNDKHNDTLPDAMRRERQRLEVTSHSPSRRADRRPETLAVRKRILLVGADDIVAAEVKVGDVVKVKHGWHLHLPPLPSPSRVDSPDTGDTEWEVCWGPIQS